MPKRMTADDYVLPIGTDCVRLLPALPCKAHDTTHSASPFGMVGMKSNRRNAHRITANDGSASASATTFALGAQARGLGAWRHHPLRMTGCCFSVTAARTFGFFATLWSGWLAVRFRAWDGHDKTP